MKKDKGTMVNVWVSKKTKVHLDKVSKKDKRDKQVQ